jgi:ribonuclease HI
VSASDAEELLRRLAAGAALAKAARAAGFPSTAAASAALLRLADRVPSISPDSDASPGGGTGVASGERAARPTATSNALGSRAGRATTLPPAPPVQNPYPPGSEAVVLADGACRGNPGPAAYGCAYADAAGRMLCGEGVAIGHATNNVAEYRGAIAALERLSGWGVRRAVLRLDSQLVVRQVTGAYRVKDPVLQQLHGTLVQRVRAFERLQVEHVPRAQNAVADALANHALDQAQGGRASR